MSEQTKLTKTELAQRWACTPAGVDFAVRQGIIPEPENGLWYLADIQQAERETFDPSGLADRMARLATYKNMIPVEQYRNEARETLQDVVAEFAGTPYFSDALNLYKEATNGAVMYE